MRDSNDSVLPDAYDHDGIYTSKKPQRLSPTFLKVALIQIVTTTNTYPSVLPP